MEILGFSEGKRIVIKTRREVSTDAGIVFIKNTSVHTVEPNRDFRAAMQNLADAVCVIEPRLPVFDLTAVSVMIKRKVGPVAIISGVYAPSDEPGFTFTTKIEYGGSPTINSAISEFFDQIKIYLTNQEG